MPNIRIQDSLRNLLWGFLSCLYHQPGKRAEQIVNSHPELWCLQWGLTVMGISSRARHKLCLRGTSQAVLPARTHSPTHNCPEACSFSKIGSSDSHQFFELGKDFEWLSLSLFFNHNWLLFLSNKDRSCDSKHRNAKTPLTEHHQRQATTTIRI